MSTTFWIQFLGIIFGSAMIYFSFVKFKRKELNSGELWLWWGGWIALILIAIFPGLLDPLIGPLNFYRRLDFFIVLGFFVLLGLAFYTYGIVKKLEKKLELFVRQDTLRQHQQEREQSKRLQENK